MPPSGDLPQQSGRRLDALAVALLLAMVLLAFWPVTRAGFVNWDDTDMVVTNLDLNPPRLTSIARYWQGPHMGLYIPLTYTAYGLLAWIGKMSATPFHVASLLFHAAGAVFVWLILRRLNMPRIAAWLGAAVFAVHPIQTEAVAWVASLNTVLSGSLALAALWCYVEHATRAGSTQWFTVATVLFLLALFAKPSAVVLPILAAAIDFLMLRRPIAGWWRGIAVWLVLAGVFAIVARTVQPASTVAAPPIFNRLLVAGDAVVFYMQKVLIPRAFAIDYGRTPDLPVNLWRAIIAAALLAAAWRWREKEPAITAGVVIFVLALLPVVGLVSFDFQRFSTVADRYVYPGMLGVALLVGRCAAHGRTVRGALLLGLGVLCVLTMLQSARWHDTYVLGRHSLSVNPRSLAAHKVLAATYAADRDIPRATHHYEAALAARPSDGEVHFNYANLLLRQRDYAQAIMHYTAARLLRPKDVRVLKNLAVALAGIGAWDDAERAILEALRLAPNDAELQRNRQLLRQLRPATTTGATSPATRPS